MLRFRYIALIITGFFISMDAHSQLTNNRGVEYMWRTDTTMRSIDLREVELILPRNSFPKIDFPNFVGRSEGKRMFYEHEPVIAVAINDQAKAYPLNMLTMHEMSNDSLGGVPILPTYCPLCNSSVVYDRRVEIDGQQELLHFEVSGMLRQSDMIMADQETETWWQQLTGEAMVGKLTGQRLSTIPSMVISVGEFFESYPEGLILSVSTGVGLDDRYGKNPYTHYDKEDGLPYGRYFDKEKIDERLPAMERVIDVQTGEGYKIYPFGVLEELKVINDHLGDKNIVIFYKSGTVSVLDETDISASRQIGSATVFRAEWQDLKFTFEAYQNNFRDLETSSIWDITGKCIKGPMKGRRLMAEKHGIHFAFAWLNFHPDSDIYGLEE